MVCCLEAKIVKTSCYCFLKIIVSSLKKCTVMRFYTFHPIEEKTTELLAVRLAESLPLEQSQKKSLNNLFAKSATWEMI